MDIERCVKCVVSTEEIEYLKLLCTLDSMPSQTSAFIQQMTPVTTQTAAFIRQLLPFSHAVRFYCDSATVPDIIAGMSSIATSMAPNPELHARLLAQFQKIQPILENLQDV